eukprot:TRINITY_DN3114_c0_g1_i1.p1 TRINITY_DN3114_c0_g1~~TRINITY_DN3114_c0_g1_i1.p1  ORF type:complete len:291 (+),score=50.79 TRINITY_DN3114_c0_g1_i1:10-882(+)
MNKRKTMSNSQYTQTFISVVKKTSEIALDDGKKLVLIENLEKDFYDGGYSEEEKRGIIKYMERNIVNAKIESKKQTLDLGKPIPLTQTKDWMLEFPNTAEEIVNQVKEMASKYQHQLAKMKELAEITVSTRDIKPVNEIEFNRCLQNWTTKTSSNYTSQFIENHRKTNQHIELHRIMNQIIHGHFCHLVEKYYNDNKDSDPNLKKLKLEQFYWEMNGRLFGLYKGDFATDLFMYNLFSDAPFLLLYFLVDHQGFYRTDHIYKNAKELRKYLDQNVEGKILKIGVEKIYWN